ncbi:MAG: alpha/beta fold hydrolase [Gammaproteobacteria bacterium]|nr:alpha/beta fold hydrolase [Gammaproteobacteria bacterium]
MRDYRPPWLLRSPHAQSMLASGAMRRRMLRHRATGMLSVTKDLIADCGDGVRLLLHHSPPANQEVRRVAVIIHGWEGSGNANYMLAAGGSLWDAGYRVVRLNLRDHGESHHLNRDLFHSCRLDEVVGAISWVQRRYPDEPLFLGGYSLGGNFALRVAVAAPAAGLQLQRIAAVCPVLDPISTMYALDGGWFFYRYYFLRKWRRSLERKRLLHPGYFRFGDLGRFRTLQGMTDFFVREYTEFPDLMTYLKGYAITGERLANLEISTRVLLARDDPVIPIVDVERLASPAALRVEISRYGGHCGFIADYRLRSVLDDFFLETFESPTRDDIHSR